MRITLAIFALLTLFAATGCGQIQRVNANLTGYSIICVKETGVKYVQFPSGVARLDDQNGNPVKC